MHETKVHLSVLCGAQHKTDILAGTTFILMSASGRNLIALFC